MFHVFEMKKNDTKQKIFLRKAAAVQEKNYFLKSFSH